MSYTYITVCVLHRLDKLTLDSLVSSHHLVLVVFLFLLHTYSW